MNKFSNLQNFLGLLLAMGVALPATQAKCGCKPYLPLLGPSPLRFEVAVAESPLILAELTLPKPKASEPIPLPKTPPAGNGTASAVVNVAGGPMGIFGGPANNAEGPLNPASDMLNVSPQMIAQYLKPNRSEPPPAAPSQFQPGQSILVPAELGFVPPMPGGNRQIYMNK